ncbi:MAG: molecular chaperone TorD family protein [Desulfobacteraceae bacterium]
MKPDELLSREQARGDSFKLLSDCYYPPDAELGQKLKELGPQMAVTCDEAFQYLYKMTEALASKDDLGSLEVEHAKLFVGPYKLLAPPYGSVYLEGERRVMGDSTLDARDRYHEAGVGISEGFYEVPDHIAAELEFMYFLIFREIEAIVHGDIDGAIDHLTRQKAFLQLHLGAWVPAFAQHVEKNAKTEFYKNLARCTGVFVKKELEESIVIAC